MKLDANAAWEAVRMRRPAPFFYCVRTTGIYCRPTCPSRRPRREHVRFVARAEEAERAGFRACRRCRPRDAESPDQAMARRVCAAIEAALAAGEPITLRALGQAVGLSGGRVQRRFTKALGLSPRAWAAQRRLERFRDALRDHERVTDAVYSAGYRSGSRAYEGVQGRLGMTPRAYREQGAGMAIRFTVVASRLGPVLVAATQRGLCSVRFGVDEAALERALRMEFPRAELHGPDRVLGAWARSVVRAIDGRAGLTALPLDVRATAFQRRVWEALRRIPIGETRSYREVAESIGRPSAARAVAQACAANPVALAVPCHRVVRQDRSLGGYRWETRRKRQLLAAERAGERTTESGAERANERAGGRAAVRATGRAAERGEEPTKRPRKKPTKKGASGRMRAQGRRRRAAR